jgi:hypothetical protein
MGSSLTTGTTTCPDTGRAVGEDHHEWLEKQLSHPFQVEKGDLWRTLPPTATTPFQLERETYGA